MLLHRYTAVGQSTVGSRQQRVEPVTEGFYLSATVMRQLLSPYQTATEHHELSHTSTTCQS